MLAILGFKHSLRNLGLKMKTLSARIGIVALLISIGVEAFPVSNSKYRSVPSKLYLADQKFDLAVIGAGVVGVTAALAAASAPHLKKVCLIDAPRESGMLMNGDEDLSIGGPTGLFGKALRDTSKRIKVSTLRGMGLREER